MPYKGLLQRKYLLSKYKLLVFETCLFWKCIINRSKEACLIFIDAKFIQIKSNIEETKMKMRFKYSNVFNKYDKFIFNIFFISANAQAL
jgi:hypothetical protein